MAEKKPSTKEQVTPTYPPANTPFIYVDDCSAVSSSSTFARFYLLQDRPTLDESSDTRAEVTLELGMTLGAYFRITMNLYDTLNQMMNRGAYSQEMVDTFREVVSQIQSQADPIEPTIPQQKSES